MFKRHRNPPPGARLHQCPVCNDDSVVPVRIEPLDLGRWDLRLRCGGCGVYQDIVVSDEVAKRYDRDLSRGMDEIAAALEREDDERMVAEAQTFIAALDHDLIDADDFRL
jgi:transcription elongation factor Elf1